MQVIPLPAIHIADPLLFLGRTPVKVDFELHTYTQVVVRGEENCWMSKARFDPNMHIPCFDVDISKEVAYSIVDEVFPESAARWVPSSTEGHHHVYINYAYTWEDYKERLKILTMKRNQFNTVVELAYFSHSCRHGGTIVRMPHIKRDKPRNGEEYKVDKGLTPLIRTSRHVEAAPPDPILSSIPILQRVPGTNDAKFYQYIPGSKQSWWSWQ